MGALLSASRDFDRLIGFSLVIWLQRFSPYNYTLRKREYFDRLRWEI